ncbi:daunorubicin resistance protein DrrA family ABC transporter ATP-binding protein [Methanomassiliicoccus luminyensis]|jgi:ABC-2 type transport system ATP-binding protein|uniref:daunorubicin resistance protein DrrA family ABC transporter ATP-binding protein n=1 Tax=Methanomassiliicoccus luminyensis TaxID=1080712 RepID=UPI000370914A|nr:daunorubicin resistance protein DrrA family ABC transporter ATP-binding protein [Methanomassiliicoccus luminyensis]
MSTIEISGLSRRFGKFTAVDHLDLQVQGTEVFGLLGPNGAGKTTTIKMLTTLLPPSSGKASIGGYDIVERAKEVRGVIGYVPQMLSADPALTGRENLTIFAKLYDVPRSQRADRVQDAIEKMGLVDFGDKQVRTYSGGMIRRLEIAQSTLHRPRVLFLDEPTVGLDPIARRTVWEMVKLLRDDYGTTIFLTTHLMDEADLLCDRIGIMHKGKLVALGTPRELKEEVGASTLDDVFVAHAGTTLESSNGGNYREIQRERRTAQRLG